jgi:hypothetical protein
MPQRTTLPCLLCYEELLSAETLPADVRGFQWRARDEHAPAALCFTSGTTGACPIVFPSPIFTSKADRESFA